jgi:hypothetical protein
MAKPDRQVWHCARQKREKSKFCFYYMYMSRKARLIPFAEPTVANWTCQRQWENESPRLAVLNWTGG